MNFDFIPTWADAIAQFEGFNSAGSRPQRNNNPGDLKYAGQPGAIGKDSAGFAVFPDAGTGFQALYTQLQKYVTSYPGDSILDITAHYLGQSTPTSDSQGNAYTYAAYVASALGVDMSTTLGQLANPTPAGVPIPAGLTDGTPVDASLIDPDTGVDTASLAPASSSSSAIMAIVAVGVIFILARNWFD
jgi:hypothetical protein